MGIVVHMDSKGIYVVDGNSNIPFTNHHIGVRLSYFYLEDKNIEGYGRPYYENILSSKCLY